MDHCSACRSNCASAWKMQPCKHALCRKCMSRGKITDCLTCGEDITLLQCPGSVFGCTFSTSRGIGAQHELKCMLLPVECPYQCDSVMTKKTLSQHINSECPLRHATCRYCHDTVFRIELDDHEKSCLEAPVACSFCRTENIRRGGLSDHAKGCADTPKPCPLNEYGCSFVGLDSVMDDHLDVKNHVSCFQQLKKSLDERDAEIVSLRAYVDTLKNEMRESITDGTVPFETEVRWTVKAPEDFDLRTPRRSSGGQHVDGQHAVTSPVYERRSTKTAFCFTLACARRDGAWYVSLHQRVLAEAESLRGEMFIVTVTNVKPGRAPVQIAETAAVRCEDRNLLDWVQAYDGFYIVTCVAVTVLHRPHSARDGAFHPHPIRVHARTHTKK